MKNIKVGINRSLDYHPGYHNSLTDNPPEGIEYIFPKIEKRIPIFNFIEDPKNCIKYLHYGPGQMNIDFIPYFIESIDLIHSPNRPIINKVPFVVDTDFFGFPWIFDQKEFSLILSFKKPLIFTLSNSLHKNRLKSLLKPLKTKYCKKILPWSQSAMNYMKKIISDEEIIKKIEVLYPAVSVQNFKKKHDNSARLLYCGKEYRRKGGKDLLKAFEILNKSYDIELTFVGEIPNNEIKKYFKYKNIKYYPFLEKKDLLEIYKKSDIFVLPTKMESFCMVFLEAMSFGLPVITTKGKNMIATKEIIEENKNGFLIDVEGSGEPSNYMGKINFEDFINKLKILIENVSLRKKMGKTGKKEIEKGKFNIEKRNERLKQIYKKALE